MRWRYLYLETSNPYVNLAWERCLFERVQDDEAILLLWQNADTIVIGRNQDVYAECRAEEFLQDGGRIARRRSGGGAVYHDLGNLNVSVIGKKSFLCAGNYRELVIQALCSCGIPAEYNGRNDLLVYGKKFSGSACYDNGEAYCCHGTILIHTDTERMARYLTPSAGKLARNGVKSVGARVGNLSEVKPGLTVKQICGAMICASGAQPLQADVDRQKLATYTAFFEDKKWIFGGKL